MVVLKLGCLEINTKKKFYFPAIDCGEIKFNWLFV